MLLISHLQLIPRRDDIGVRHSRKESCWSKNIYLFSRTNVSTVRWSVGSKVAVTLCFGVRQEKKLTKIRPMTMGKRGTPPPPHASIIRLKTGAGDENLPMHEHATPLLTPGIRERKTAMRDGERLLIIILSFILQVLGSEDNGQRDGELTEERESRVPLHFLC